MKRDVDAVEIVELRQRLKRLLARAPDWCADAGYDSTHEWKRRHANATKVANDGRSSAASLRGAIASMEWRP